MGQCIIARRGGNATLSGKPFFCCKLDANGKIYIPADKVQIGHRYAILVPLRTVPAATTQGKGTFIAHFMRKSDGTITFRTTSYCVVYYTDAGNATTGNSGGAGGFAPPTDGYYTWYADALKGEINAGEQAVTIIDLE